MDDGNMITFGVPKGEIKEAYFDLILKQLYHLGLQISQPAMYSGSQGSTYSATNIPVMVSFIISHIPKKERREELRTKINTELKSRLDDRMSNEKKLEITIETYIEFVGLIADYLEKFMGIEKENRLGIIGDIKCKECGKAIKDE